MALVRANIEEDTKAVHDGFTNNISFQHHDQKIIHKPLSLREVCDDQIRRREKRKQGKNLSCGGKKHNLEFEKLINRLRLLCSSSRRYHNPYLLRPFLYLPLVLFSFP